ncbi:MAG: hypothetical protein L3J31_08760 [Bacteroidales bacterium]|nr:hypothetical protein [Bacteroidales bacterium]
MNILKIALGLSLGTVLFISACKKDEITEQQLIFTFNHFVKTDAVEFDTIIYENAFGNPYSVATLKYFVSDFTLHLADGSTVLIDDEHYVDARDASTLTYTPQVKIPLGNYTGLSFTFGLDTLKNITGRFPNPPENNMEWPLAMGPGYHYMKLEGKFDSTGIVKNYQAHTGQSMGNPYYFTVSLPGVGFSCDCSSVNIDIFMDINKWWESPNTFDLNNMSAVMGNQEVQQKLKENGNDVFTAKVN